jgi:alkanesulfonate monooxygenase SsuD/methylene tetrahydromethanopterin reductase-like flavin-dependent oxidoreductase (luciferase family)
VCDASPLRGLSTDAILDRLVRFPAIVGSPAEVVRQIRDFEAAGVTEIALQWLAPDDIDGLEMLAAEVLPQVTAGPS